MRLTGSPLTRPHPILASETHPAVANVRVLDRLPATARDVEEWEALHAPHRLPEDVVAFVCLMDGLSVRWQGKAGSENVPVGSLCVNGLKHLEAVPVDRWHLMPVVRLGDGPGSASTVEHGVGSTTSSARPRGRGSDADGDDNDDDDDDEWNESGAPRAVRERPPQGSYPAAFDLDQTCQGGRVALLYRSAGQAPSVWFQDSSCRWHFLCDSFLQYFRLMVVHLGLTYWQYAFTDVGLVPAARVWMRLLAPERLRIDDQMLLQRSEALRAAGIGASGWAAGVVRPHGSGADPHAEGGGPLSAAASADDGDPYCNNVDGELRDVQITLIDQWMATMPPARRPSSATANPAPQPPRGRAAASATGGGTSSRPASSARKPR